MALEDRLKSIALEAWNSSGVPATVRAINEGTRLLDQILTQLKTLNDQTALVLAELKTSNKKVK